jgi:hypothetical protein
MKVATDSPAFVLPTRNWLTITPFVISIARFNLFRNLNGQQNCVTLGVQ